MSEKETSQFEGCKGRIVIDEGTWKIEVEKGCSNALEGIKQLGPASKKYVCKHMQTADPEVKAKMDEACR